MGQDRIFLLNRQVWAMEEFLFAYVISFVWGVGNSLEAIKGDC